MGRDQSIPILDVLVVMVRPSMELAILENGGGDGGCGRGTTTRVNIHNPENSFLDGEQGVHVITQS